MQPRGFTLIELLVVIAIIGLLASIILVSLNSARGKGRDASRVASLQEMAKAIAIADSGLAVKFNGCTGTGSSASPNSVTNNAASCTGPSPISFVSYKDPSTSGTLCNTLSSGTCQYLVARQSGATGNPSTQDYEICTWLETKVSGSLGPGLVRVDSNTGTSIVTGCN